MATEVQTPPETGIASLLKGIVNDVGDLISKQLQFAKAEIRTDLRQTGEASRLLAIGVGMASLGTLVLVLMLIHLLHWLTSPAGTDPAALPLWACYAIVGSLVLVIGAVLVVAGKKKFDAFNPLPDKTADSIKENLQWMTNSK